MTDEFEVIDQVQETATRQTWARKLMAGVREVQALHTAVTKFNDAEDGTVYASQEEAEATGKPYESFIACAECSRISTTEWVEWPCATAIALGIENGPLL